MNNLEETTVFIIYSIKQFCFGFEAMSEISDHYRDGSPAKAFFLNAIYQYLAVFYLIDKGSNPIGGYFILL